MSRDLPTRPEFAGRKTSGFATSTVDQTPQRMEVPPKRVLPIIFLPGIMGTNLRLTAESGRQQQLGNPNNIAWRPDNLGITTPGDTSKAGHLEPPMRQQLFDPNATEVDTYDPDTNPTGNPNETADQRHANAKVGFGLPFHFRTPLLMDDPKTASNPRTKEQKARARGWGEVFFGSYGELLQLCELQLNAALSTKDFNRWWQSEMIGVEPQRWQRAAPADGSGNASISLNSTLKPLTLDDLKQAVGDCWLPVHAVGYNWLKSNRDSGRYVAGRIAHVIAEYVRQGFECEKVIVVTHSMGGLVARALIHPEMGNFNDKVLGIIHGVLPSIGAGAAYRRIRCGFEGMRAAASVPGNYGDEVTAVLGNSQGGLELLPTQAYGNEWLRITINGKTVKSLPQNGDPYEEIYKLQDRWYRLLREEWLNPAKARLAGYQLTALYLDQAKAFHAAIADTYHDLSYAHYGADPNQPAWRNVVWKVDSQADVPDVDSLSIAEDDMQGKLTLSVAQPAAAFTGKSIKAILMDPIDPGDRTVPQFSADHQLRSGKFKAVFQQQGYEHQGSYQNSSAICSTLYCLVKIAQTMTWCKS